MNYKKLSEEIAEYLFMCTFRKQKAYRLLQEMPNGEITGGYIESAIANAIEIKLRENGRKKNKRSKAKP